MKLKLASLAIALAIMVAGGLLAQRDGFVLNREQVLGLQMSDKELSETAGERIAAERPEIILVLVDEEWQNCVKLKAGDAWCWEVGP